MIGVRVVYTIDSCHAGPTAKFSVGGRYRDAVKREGGDECEK